MERFAGANVAPMKTSLLPRISAVLFAFFLALIALACSGDDDGKERETKAQTTPEFVRDTRSAPTMGTLPPPIIISFVTETEKQRTLHYLTIRHFGSRLLKGNR